MKKLFPTLALAMTCGMAMAAIPGIQQTKQITPIKTSEASSMKVIAKQETAKLHKVASKLPSSIDDLYCNYRVISGVQNGQDAAFMEGEIVMYPSDQADEVAIYGLDVFSGSAVYATVDMSEGTITFPATQLLGILTLEGEQTQLSFTHYTTDDAGYFVEAKTPAVGYITDFGIEFDSFDFMGLEVASIGGPVWMYWDLAWYARPLSLSVETDWLDTGMATVNSLYFEQVMNIDLQPYQVATQTKVISFVDEDGNESEHNVLRLVNPFGEGTPFADVNDALSEGAVYFDLTNHECVGALRAYYMPLEFTDGSVDYLECGFYTGLMGFVDYGNGFGEFDVLYCGNEVGYYIESGYPYSSILQIQGITSTYEDGTVTIGDPLIGFTYNIREIADYWGEEGDLGTPTFTLNSTPEFNGVEFVTAAKDGYYTVYNLNGMRMLQTKDKSALNTLNPGLYIVNGKKVVVK